MLSCDALGTGRVDQSPVSAQGPLVTSKEWMKKGQDTGLSTVSRMLGWGCSLCQGQHVRPFLTRTVQGEPQLIPRDAGVKVVSGEGAWGSSEAVRDICVRLELWCCRVFTFWLSYKHIRSGLSKSKGLKMIWTPPQLTEQSRRTEQASFIVA